LRTGTIQSGRMAFRREKKPDEGGPKTVSGNLAIKGNGREGGEREGKIRIT